MAEARDTTTTLFLREMAFHRLTQPEIKCSRVPQLGAMAVPPLPSTWKTLTDQLTMPEDESLAMERDHQGAVSEHLKRPTGIQTLEQWGQVKAPAGKHKGRVFVEMLQDKGYVRQMWNRRGVASWVRSFQYYCRAMEIYEKKNQMGPIAASSTSTLGWTSTSHGKQLDDEGWEIMKSPGEPGPPQALAAARPRKRGPDPKGRAKMALEPNLERVQELQTQIAVLQDRLAREVQVPDEISENEGKQ